MWSKRSADAANILVLSAGKEVVVGNHYELFGIYETCARSMLVEVDVSGARFEAMYHLIMNAAWTGGYPILAASSRPNGTRMFPKARQLAPFSGVTPLSSASTDIVATVLTLSSHVNAGSFDICALYSVMRVASDGEKQRAAVVECAHTSTPFR